MIEFVVLNPGGPQTESPDLSKTRKTIGKMMDQSKTDEFYSFLDHFWTCSTHGKPILVPLFVPLGGTCVEGASCHCTVEFCETDGFAGLSSNS